MRHLRHGQAGEVAQLGGAGGGGGTWVDARAIGPTQILLAESQKTHLSNPDDGLVRLTHVPYTNGDFCSNPIPIPDSAEMQFQFADSTSTVGFTATQGYGCQLSTEPDVWYTYTNTQGCDRDLDDNGVLDSCEVDPSQAVRLGTPPNPQALEFGNADGPVIGGTYSPWIDHTSFLPNAQQDVLFVSVTPGNLPLPGIGSALGGLAPISTLSQTAGQPFELSIPTAGSALLGLPVVFQGLSIDLTAPLGSELALTNGIDAVLGAWSAGF